ncbi:MAG: exosortase/archaeosortase family protein [Prosthecobacter sp.]|nr:exosortase/archaeosortase family protein [Prosthecobacter sp.]
MNEAVLPATSTPFWSPARVRQAVWVTAALAVIVLIAVWPYQHWNFTSRSSLLGGIIRKAWVKDSEWWYCLLAPPVVAWLIWRMRRPLTRLPLAGSWLGAPVLALGMFFFWFGYKVDTAYPGYVAGQLIMLGLILLLGGREWLRRLFFPWAFMVFMWPMVPLENMLTVPLRAITAQASAKVINLIGIAVVREGTGIHSAADAAHGLAQGALFQLDVEKPCSGIQSLFALLMISALYGHLALKGWLPRALLFASAIPMAMLGNLVRMVMLAIGSLWFGTNVAVGRNIDGHQEMSAFHLLAGLTVFVVALGGMFVLATLLEKWHAPRRKDRSASTPTSAKAPPSAPAQRTWLHIAGVLVIITAGLVICTATDTSYRVGPPGIRLELPAMFGGFVSNDQPMTSREQSLLNEDVRIERRFYTSAQRAVLTTLVLSGAEKRSLHPPEICLPSQGWVIGAQTTLPVDLGGGRQASATLITLHRDAQTPDGRRTRIRALNIYWYQGSDDTTCAGYEEHISRTYLDAIFRNVNHRWALISFFTPLKEDLPGQIDPYAELGALEDTKAFIRELMPQVLAASTAAH